jgi:hypothetical protein
LHLTVFAPPAIGFGDWCARRWTPTVGPIGDAICVATADERVIARVEVVVDAAL